MADDMKWLGDFLDISIPMWQEDPVIFFREVLRFEPDKWQAEAARDLAHHPRVSIKSGQGVGKTGLEAALFLWFLTCFPYPRIVATAPTKQQLHDVLWSEISKWMSRSPLLTLLLKWTKTYVYMKGNEKRWFGVARTATKPENMQGFHEDYNIHNFRAHLVLKTPVNRHFVSIWIYQFLLMSWKSGVNFGVNGVKNSMGNMEKTCPGLMPKSIGMYFLWFLYIIVLFVVMDSAFG
jgi:hypothetical protein